MQRGSPDGDDTEQHGHEEHDRAHLGAAIVRLIRLDHVVLYASDIDRTIEFYTSVLGMTHAVFDDGYHALHFGEQKINLHDAAAPFQPHAVHPKPGTFDVCLLTDSPMAEVLDHLRAHEVIIVEGPCEQKGAMGPMVSVYFHDPDGNLVEIANYDDDLDQPATAASAGGASAARNNHPSQ